MRNVQHKRIFLNFFAQHPKDYNCKKFFQTEDYLDESEISSDVPIYRVYSGPSPYSTNIHATLVLKNLDDGEFVKIGKTGNVELHVLKDNNHPLYRLQIESKFPDYSDEGEEYVLGDDEDFFIVSSFEDYVSKNPLLFFKDYWGRRNVLGKYELPVL